MGVGSTCLGVRQVCILNLNNLGYILCNLGSRFHRLYNANNKHTDDLFWELNQVIHVMTNWKDNEEIPVQAYRNGAGWPLRIWFQICLCTTKSLNFLWTISDLRTGPVIFRTAPALCSLMVSRSLLVTMQPFQTPTNTCLSTLTSCQLQL